jgi:copper chaperone
MKFKPCRRAAAAAVKIKTEECKMQTTILNVEGMSCSHCESAVKKAVGALAGVKNVSVDLSGKTVTIDYNSDQVSLEDIRLAIEDQGYDVA